ncbi:MAG TPA: hypothetical protein VJX67_05470 [Blastocatellia bacterium]|nr:hypothetical protein [Blastocatellia bacterium]
MGRSHPPNTPGTGASEEFERLLRLLHTDRDTAAAEYERARTRLTLYFRKRGCPAPEGLVDQTITRVIQKLAQGHEITNINAYWFGVARFVLKEYWASRGRDGASLDDLTPSQEPFLDPLAAEREDDALRSEELKTECMRQCYQALPDDERTLLARYCGTGTGKRSELASSMEMNIKSIRVKIHRLRLKLNKCLSNCLKEPIASEI